MADIKKKRRVTLDEMLDYVGPFNRFQWILDTIFCIMIIPQTFQVLIMYFGALPSDWRCRANSTICRLNGTIKFEDERLCNIPRSEWEFVESKKFSIITEFDIYCSDMWLVNLTTSIMFVGWGIGAVFLGWIADNYGRKIVLFPSSVILIFLGFINSFLPNITIFVIFRFAIGFFTPGVGVQEFILISELVGSKYRPFAGIVLWLFFTLALCIVGLKAYFIREWKLLFIACSIPYIFVIVFYKFVPESLRWLHIHNKREEIEKLFQRIAKWNKKKIPENVELMESPNADSHKASPLDLFRPTKNAFSTLAQGYAWFVFGMGYYGLSLAADDLGGSLYRNYVLVSAVEFPAIVVAIDFCQRFGRKKTVIYPMIVGGICCTLVAFVPSTGSIKSLRVTMGMLGKFFITISFDAIYTWSVEIFSTNIRAEGMGFLQVTSRLGAATAPWVAKGLKTLHHTVPFITMGILTLIGSGFLFILPETRGRPVDCEIQELLHIGDSEDDKLMKENSE